MFAVLLGISCLFVPLCAYPAAEPSPFYSDHYLAAGSGDAQHLDGNYLSAAFNKPGGLALDQANGVLYVADTGNNAIRGISLRLNNRVFTLAGPAQGLAAPLELCLTADGRRLVFTQDKAPGLKAASLVGGGVSTVYSPLSSTASQPRSLALDESSGDIFFINSPAKTLLRLNLGTGLAESVGSHEMLGHMARMSFHKQALFAYAMGEGMVYRIRGDGADIGAAAQAISSAVRSLAFEELPALREGQMQGMALARGETGTSLLFWDEKAGIRMLNLETGLVDLNRPADEEGNPLARPILTGPVEGAYDPASRTYYLSSPGANQIAAFRIGNRWAGGSGGLKDEDYPARKRPGSTRLLAVGDSLIFRNELSPNIRFTFPRRFEAHLNELVSREGLGGDYEVLTCGEHLGHMAGGPATYIAGRGKILPSYQVDEVLLCISYLNVVSEALGFLRTRPEGNLAGPSIDPEWALLSVQEQEARLGPLSLRLRRMILSDRGFFGPYFDLGPDGRLVPRLQGTNQQRLLAHKEFRDTVLEIFAQALAAAKRTASTHGARLKVLLLPNRNQAGLGEMQGGGRNFDRELSPALLDGPLLQAASRLGIPFINLTTPARRLSMSVYPLFQISDDHFSARGHDWMAREAARAYVEQAAAPSAPDPGPAAAPAPPQVAKPVFRQAPKPFVRKPTVSKPSTPRPAAAKPGTAH